MPSLPRQLKPELEHEYIRFPELGYEPADEPGEHLRFLLRAAKIGREKVIPAPSSVIPNKVRNLAAPTDFSSFLSFVRNSK